MRRSLKNIWDLGVKELFGLLRNPLMLLLIAYSFTLNIKSTASSAKDAINDIAIAIVDEDHSVLSRRICDAFLPPFFKRAEVIQAYEVDRVQNEGLYTFVLTLPLGMERDILKHRKPSVRLDIDATQNAVAYSGAGAVESIVTSEIRRHISRENVPEEKFIELETRNRYNPNLTQKWYEAVIGLVRIIAMLSIILTGSALINEREHGTMEHLLVMPVSPFEIIVSKIWAMSAVVLVTVTISVYLVIHLWLGVPIEGSVPLFLVGVAFALFAINSLGIYLATVANSMPQLGMLVILVLLPMSMLSGSSTPLESMPPFIRKCALFLPTTHFNMLSRDIFFRGAGLEVVWKSFLALFLIGLVLFLLSLFRFRKSVSNG